MCLIAFSQYTSHGFSVEIQTEHFHVVTDPKWPGQVGQVFQIITKWNAS